MVRPHLFRLWSRLTVLTMHLTVAYNVLTVLNCQEHNWIEKNTRPQNTKRICPNPTGPGIQMPQKHTPGGASGSWTLDIWAWHEQQSCGGKSTPIFLLVICRCPSFLSVYFTIQVHTVHRICKEMLGMSLRLPTHFLSAWNTLVFKDNWAHCSSSSTETHDDHASIYHVPLLSCGFCIVMCLLCDLSYEIKT